MRKIPKQIPQTLDFVKDFSVFKLSISNIPEQRRCNNFNCKNDQNMCIYSSASHRMVHSNQCLMAKLVTNISNDEVLYGTICTTVNVGRSNLDHWKLMIISKYLFNTCMTRQVTGSDSVTAKYKLNWTYFQVQSIPRIPRVSNYLVYLWPRVWTCILNFKTSNIYCLPVYLTKSVWYNRIFLWHYKNKFIISFKPSKSLRNGCFIWFWWTF